MTTPSEWLGHRDLCPIQWGEPCDCEEAPNPEPATCTNPGRNHGDGRGCQMDDCPKHGGESRA